MDFKKRDEVKFKTQRGRTGQGVVQDVLQTTRGAWVHIKEADGTVSKCRPVNVQKR